MDDSIMNDGLHSHEDALYELKWDDFQCTLATSCSYLREQEDLVDVSLVSGGRRWAAHKLVLCAASPWFKTLLMDSPCKHPIIILNEQYEEYLPSILDFMYSGSVRVTRSSLPEFMKLTEYLQIKGLAESNEIGSEFFERGKHKTPPDESLMQDSVKRPCPSTPEQNLPSPCTPYTFLEPKLEIHDDPVEYSDYLNDTDPVQPNYTQYSSSPGYHHEKYTGEQNMRDHNQYECTTSQNHNSIQDLMNITGRFKEMSSSRNVQRFNSPAVNPGPLVCNASSSGYQRLSSNSNQQYNTKQLEERSLVPYIPIHQQQLQQAPCPLPSPLHSLDTRFCELCGKHYSNSSNLKQHIRLIHMPGNLFCPICQKNFKNKLYLRRHVISFHENV